MNLHDAVTKYLFALDAPLAPIAAGNAQHLTEVYRTRNQMRYVHNKERADEQLRLNGVSAAIAAYQGPAWPPSDLEVLKARVKTHPNTREFNEAPPRDGTRTIGIRSKSGESRGYRWDDAASKTAQAEAWQSALDWLESTDTAEQTRQQIANHPTVEAAHFAPDHVAIVRRLPQGSIRWEFNAENETFQLRALLQCLG